MFLGDALMPLFEDVCSDFPYFSYNATTGVFTVPSGGNGSYYFSMYMRVDTGEFALFGIEVNDDTVCYGTGEMNNIPGGTPDTQQATCSAVANIAEGNSSYSLKF